MVEGLPKVFVLARDVGPVVECVALSETGYVLARTSSVFVPRCRWDLGLDGSRRHHDEYRQHFDQEFTLVWIGDIPPSGVNTELDDAISLFTIMNGQPTGVREPFAALEEVAR